MSANKSKINFAAENVAVPRDVSPVGSTAVERSRHSYIVTVAGRPGDRPR